MKKLRTAVVAGTPPEASIGDIFSYALYADQGALLDLTPLVKRDRTYHYRDSDTQPVLNRLVAAAFRGERGMKDALLEGARQGNAAVEFGKRCFQPRWKKQ